MEGIGIIVNQGERHVYRANCFWLEIIDPYNRDRARGRTSQLAIGLREEIDPDSNSSATAITKVFARFTHWCWIEEPKPQIDGGMASACREPINGWEFGPQAIEAETLLPLPEWTRDKLPVAPA